MSKRVADKYLTDQNWDEEDEPEAAGHFRSAEKDVLERRIFKTAKRRINESAKKSGAFSGFTGLKVPNTSTGNDSFKPFSSTPFTFTNSNKKPLASNVQLIPDEILKKASAKLGMPADSNETKQQAEVGTEQVRSLPVASMEEEHRILDKCVEAYYPFLRRNRVEEQEAAEQVATDELSDFFPLTDKKELQGSRTEELQDSRTEEQRADFTTEPLHVEKANICKVLKECVDKIYPGTDSPLLCVVFKASTEEKFQPMSAEGGEKVDDASSKAANAAEESTRLAEYNRHLSALNRSVSKWIQQHVEKNPLCDLTPIFKDYRKHLANIDEKFCDLPQAERFVSYSADDVDSCSSRTTSTATSAISADPSFFQCPTELIDLPIKSASEPVVWPSQSETSSVGQGPDDESTSTSVRESSRTNGTTVSTAPSGSSAPFSPFKGFNVNASNIFSLKKSAPQNNAAPPSSSQQKSENDEGEYIPPVAKVEVVKEDGAFYTKKCKLFYMKDGSYVDRGVGHVHLKPVPSSAKTQLVVRAETSLGNLLLNIILNPAMPVSRQGKNNVAISCLPNPPLDGGDKVVPMLIRVKTSDEADELEKLLNEKKAE